MYLADLHIHSRFSRATSREGDAQHLDLWARKKGLQLIGTGDFTHPAWRKELRDTLLPAEEGFYRLKPELALDAETAGAEEPARFVMTGEISSIYKKNGKTRKVHNVIVLPDIEAADALSRRLERIGNIHSDGRPILGLDSRDLLEITLETCPEAMLIPAHIWTPHFSIFGAFSGFDTIEECFEDLAGEIHALETGLSSDPPMNWRISALDRFTLVSNSDAHSPGKLGREANIIDGEFSYAGLKQAIETGEGFAGTIEFFPEEGKYHYDGHRNCQICMTPAESVGCGELCPVCGKRLTIGVDHRVLQLADRPANANVRSTKARPFESLMPLLELIGASEGISPDGKEAARIYGKLLRELGQELPILRCAELEDIRRVSGSCVSEGVRRLRLGLVQRTAGYDGCYGKIGLFLPGEQEELRGQTALFQAASTQKPKRTGKTQAAAAIKEAIQDDEKEAVASDLTALNAEQRAAVESDHATIVVIAGPGTGKTKTLIERIAYLVETKNVSPKEITAVTFTNQAAKEVKERLKKRLPQKSAAKDIAVGTFHALCLALLDVKPILGESDSAAMIGALCFERGMSGSAKKTCNSISAFQNGAASKLTLQEQEILSAYLARKNEQGVRDLDDLILDAAMLDVSKKKQFHYLLVDEYQDINPAQRRLVTHWAKGNQLFVIGDPDQSIYGFRGASAACFEELKKERPETLYIHLQVNYRSTPEILGAANTVINHNSGQPRAFLAKRFSGEAIRLITAASPTMEAIAIAKEIACMAGGIEMHETRSDEKQLRAFSEIAVLARTHRQLDEIERCLVHDGIPCLIHGREETLENEAVCGALAFFRWLGNPLDRYALSICLKNNYDAKTAAISAVTDFLCRQEENGNAAAVLDCEACPAGFRADVAELMPLLLKEKPRKLLERWTLIHPGGKAMEKLMDMALYDGSMAGFLQTLTFGEEGDIRRMHGKTYASGAVRLMTLHGAKGLEFPVVFLAGLQRGVLPMEREGEAADIEEERRLLFVGMTRAREKLILTGAVPLSGFCAELPEGTKRERAASEHAMPNAKQLKLF